MIANDEEDIDFDLVGGGKKHRLNTRRKGHKKGGQLRRLCKKCSKRPVAVNYLKEGKTYYRSVCDHCARDRKDGTPLWSLKGYADRLLGMRALQ